MGRPRWLVSRLTGALVGLLGVFVHAPHAHADTLFAGSGVGGPLTVTGFSAGLIWGTALLLIAGLSRLRARRAPQIAPPPLEPGTPGRLALPSLPLHHAGLVWHGRFTGAHTSALLVLLATLGAVRFRLPAPTLIVHEQPRRLTGYLRMLHFELPRTDGQLTGEQITVLNNEVKRRQAELDKEEHVFEPEPLIGQLVRLATFPGALVVSILLVTTDPLIWLRPLPSLDAWWQGTTLGVCSLFGRGLGRRAPLRLSAASERWRSELTSLAHALSTWDVRELTRAADETLFQRYLPWAVLLGVTDQWVAHCRELVALGYLPPLDLRFFGNIPANELAPALDALTEAFTTS